MSQQTHLDVHIDHESRTVTLRTNRQRQAIVARLLGAIEGDGVTHYYLDKLVHREWQELSGPWQARGAISTILSRTEPTLH